MFKVSHSHHHDWHSSEYVDRWAAKQDTKEIDRQEAFLVLANTMPYDKTAAINILDLGAGYGALTQFLLTRFSQATAVCQDESGEMAKLGQQRMAGLSRRFRYEISDFSKAGWSRSLEMRFEAVVSSIAIHNVNDPRIIRRVYNDVFQLVTPGGCFLNFDRMHPPLDDQLTWLTEAGFRNVECFWKSDRRALFGGFRSSDVESRDSLRQMP
jgi:SAM-dependent methyltransferase